MNDRKVFGIAFAALFFVVTTALVASSINKTQDIRSRAQDSYWTTACQTYDYASCSKFNHYCAWYNCANGGVGGCKAIGTSIQSACCSDLSSEKCNNISGECIWFGCTAGGIGACYATADISSRHLTNLQVCPQYCTNKTDPNTCNNQSSNECVWVSCSGDISLSRCANKGADPLIVCPTVTPTPTPDTGGAIDGVSCDYCMTLQCGGNLVGQERLCMTDHYSKCFKKCDAGTSRSCTCPGTSNSNCVQQCKQVNPSCYFDGYWDYCVSPTPFPTPTGDSVHQNRASGKNCTQICRDNYSAACISVGTDSAGTDGHVFSYISSSNFCGSFGKNDCSSNMTNQNLTQDLLNVCGGPTMWTNCRCRFGIPVFD